jgi:hypothetical protein
LTPGRTAGKVVRRLLCATRQEDVAVTVRFRFLVAAVGLWMAHPLPGLLAQESGPAIEPAPLAIEPPAADVSADQQTAQAIARQLQHGGQLRHYRIDIAFQAGAAELSGRVASEAQRDEALRLVRGVAGVRSVVDQLVVVPAGGITPVQAEAVQPPKEPAPLLPRAPTPVTGGPAAGNPVIEPMPMGVGGVGGAGGGSPYDLHTPRMPPYAWPTYAPYNNYSRVAYPEAYPYNAWPFIGPVYPFPKVPLGWRSVKLEWEDGHWWFSKLGTAHDWWRLRYW